MEKQIIISIGREHGSEGHKIAELLAQKLDFPLYDKNIFEEIGRTKGIDTNDISKYDERPRRFFITRKVNGHSNSPEENVAELQFALLKSKAADGDSFVVVGLIFMTIFDIKRYKLLDEVFGKVDDADKEIAKNLLCRIKEVDIGEFSFLNYED